MAGQKWITEWPREGPDWRILPGTRVLSVGSCFAEEVVSPLSLAKCPVVLNPTGIMYNPMSMANALEAWQSEGPMPFRSVRTREVWHSLDHHSILSALSEEELDSKVRTAQQRGSEAVRDSGIWILTFGTAWVYDWKEDGRVVANCHQQPAERFVKRLLSVDEIVTRWSALITNWHQAYPNGKAILSVSPVRHLKDGFVENQRSKATLVLAMAKLVEMFPFVHYFPAYEIMVDELRDYRFYDTDLVHPGSTGVAHIMEAFGECYLDQDARELAKKVNAIRQSLEHRPFFPQGESYAQHLDRTSQQLEKLVLSWPELDWSPEYGLLEQARSYANRTT